MKRDVRRDEFILELAALHHEAHRLGLHRTGHALHEAVRTVGWEIARQVESKARAKRKEKA